MYKYTTNLHLIRNLTAKNRIVAGGSSSGKTFAILGILINIATSFPNLHISVVGETMPFLRRGAIKDFIAIMQYTNRWRKHHWNKTLSTYTFTTGSVIEFFSVDDSSKLRGARRNILYINECNNVNFNAYNELAIRTESKDIKKNGTHHIYKFQPIIFLDYNPTGPFWVDDIKKSDNSQFLRLTYHGNEGVKEDVVKDFQEKVKWAEESEYWYNWCEVYVWGREGRRQGTIFNDYKTIKKKEFEEDVHDISLLGYGMDFGFSNDPTAIVEVWEEMNVNKGDRKKLYVREILYETNLTNQDIARKLKARGLENELIVADSAEPKSIVELKREGIRRCKGVKKGKDSISFGIRLLQEYQIIVIEEDSPNLINELNNYTWATNRAGEQLNKPIDEYNHLLDSLRYICMDQFTFKRNQAPIKFY